MRRIHNGLTVSAVVKVNQLTALRQLLAQINKPEEQLVNFAAMPSVLFSSMVIADAAMDSKGEMLPTRLLIFTSYTGSKKVHLTELIDQAWRGLHQVFLHCEGYKQQEGSEEKEATAKFLRKHIIHNTYYTGSHFITRQDQEREHELRSAIQGFLDKKWEDPAFEQANQEEVRRDIQQFVTSQETLRWAAKPYRLGFQDWLALYGSLLLIGALMLFSLLTPVVSMFMQGSTKLILWSVGLGVVLHLLWPLLQKRMPRELENPDIIDPQKNKTFSWKQWLIRLLVLTIMGSSLTATIWNAFDFYAYWPWSGILFWGFLLGMFVLLLLLRRDERIPYEPIQPLEDDRIRQIAEKEYHPVVNEMSVISTLKKGMIRPFFLAVTLRLVPLIRAFNYIPSVHSARWLQTDNGRRLVFIAYFDNTSEGYAHDFVDSTKRTRNLNLIFGHALGFPPTRYAILDGGKDRRQYMLGVRKSQLLTDVWYNSHPDLSITNVKRNRAIRKGLAGKMKEEELNEWLAML